MLGATNDVRAALQEIAELLSKYGAKTLASNVYELLDLRAMDERAFREAVRSDTMWGGAGSLSDLYLPSLASDPSAAIVDHQRLQHSILRLGEALESENLADERVREITTILRRQSESGH